MKILRRTPLSNQITIKFNSMEYVLEEDKYIEIIKPLLRIESSGRDYILLRNKTIEEYFINGPKEQFSW